MATQEKANPTVGTASRAIVLVVNRVVTHPLPRRKLLEVVSVLRTECPRVEVVETRDVAEFTDVWAGAGTSRLILVGGEEAQDVCDIEDIVSSTHALEHGLFAGKLDKSKLGFPERAVMRAVGAQEGDYRDWGAIEAWARHRRHARVEPVLG